jgi:hypothetical protein
MSYIVRIGKDIMVLLLFLALALALVAEHLRGNNVL